MRLALLPQQRTLRHQRQNQYSTGVLNKKTTLVREYDFRRNGQNQYRYCTPAILPIVKSKVSPYQMNMSAQKDIADPEVISDFCELTPRKKYILDKNARKYVRFMGMQSGFEHLLCYCGITGKELVRHTERKSDRVGLPKRHLARAKVKRSRLVLHHNHPQSMSLSAIDVQHLLARRGMVEIFAHGHDGSWYWAESLRKRNALDMAKYGDIAIVDAVSILAANHIFFDERLAPHFVNRALDRVGAIVYKFQLSTSILASLGQISEARQEWLLDFISDAIRQERQ